MNVTDNQRTTRRSATVLWVSSISLLVGFAVLLEAICLGILYVSRSIRGIDTSTFVEDHLLTRPFAPTPIGPVPGKRFLGYLRNDKPNVWAQFALADDLLGWHLAPSVSAIRLQQFKEFSPQHPLEFLYTTDANGFIADVDEPPIAMQKPGDAYRVIVLGGSIVMGNGAPRPSQNIVGMLRKGVRDRQLTGPNGRSIELINAGVDGYNSVQEYLYLVSDLLRFKPDLVIVYDGWNDSMYDPSKNISHFRTWYLNNDERRITQSKSIFGSAQILAHNLDRSLFLIRTVSS
jgi:hypothetical protein